MEGRDRCATGIEQLFTPGTRDTPDGPAVVESIDAGLLRVPSGRLIVSDPGWIVETSRTITVPPGEFPVTVSLMRATDDVRVAAARVTLLDTPPSEWEMAIQPNEDPGLLSENLIAFRAGWVTDTTLPGSAAPKAGR